MAEVVGQVASWLTTQKRKEDVLIQNLEAFQEKILDATLRFARTGDQDQVGESKAMFLDLMRLSAEVRAHAGALDEVTAGYRDMPAEGRTDFEQVLEEAGERHMPDGYDPEQDTLYMEFERELWKETHGNEPMPGALGRGDDDDDEIAEAGGDDFASNLTCPITGKAVLDLDDPVADQHGYVYEKQAILDHISRGRGGSAKCPVAGTTHSVSPGHLVQATRVLREARRRARQPTQAGPAEDILEV